MNNNMNNDIWPILTTQVLVDPHQGKTHFELRENEELDVGQIEDFTDQQIKDIGLNLLKSPVTLYWLDGELKASESITKKFDSIDELVDYMKGKSNIFCRWIKQHKKNLNCVVSFHEFSEGYDKNINDILFDLNRDINKLMKIFQPKNTIALDCKKNVKEIYDMLKNHEYRPYVASDKKSISEILTEYESSQCSI